MKIITDYRTETSLRHGCNDILKVQFLFLFVCSNLLNLFFIFYLVIQSCLNTFQTDCVNLLVKYYNEARRAVHLGIEEEGNRKKEDDTSFGQKVERASSSIKTMELKSKTRGGGRCCLCFDPFYIQNLSVVVFFCCHAYHISCLIGASDSMNETSNASDSDDDSENDNTQPSRSRMCCVLCTTAGR